MCHLYVGVEFENGFRDVGACCTWNTGFRTWLQLICCTLACLTIVLEFVEVGKECQYIGT